MYQLPMMIEAFLLRIYILQSIHRSGTFPKNEFITYPLILNDCMRLCAQLIHCNYGFIGFIKASFFYILPNLYSPFE